MQHSCKFHNMMWLVLITIKGGKDLSEAFEQATLAMFNYMVELDNVTIDETKEPREIEAEGTL